jgi:hypothetical protein
MRSLSAWLLVRASIVLAFALTTLALLGPAPTARAADALSPDLQAAKAGLEKYTDPIVAIRDGYYSTIACVRFTKSGTMNGMPYPAGGMGVHLLNMQLVGPKLDPARPQVLIYEPTANGKLQLAAAEWFMPYKKGMVAPEMFGHKFYGPMMGHYPVMPKELVHYDLHVWLWKNNPSGVFAPTNSDLKCPDTGYTITYTQPDMPMP